MNTNRVWIYLSDKSFDEPSEINLKKDIHNFLLDWSAHGTKLSSSFEILYHQIIVIKADEVQCRAGGCSIDSQINFIKELEKKYALSLLNRLLVAYKKEDKLAVTPLSNIDSFFSAGFIDKNTLIIDTSISSEEEYNHSFEKPLKETWLNNHIL
ncbi:MAG: hypothetical protein ACYDCN_00005 [Bacteroidia bacterium]